MMRWLALLACPTGATVAAAIAALLLASAAGGYLPARAQLAMSHAGKGVAGSFATFDPATLTNVTLSNSNLTATHSNTTSALAKTASAKSDGLYYFEATIGHISGNETSVGIATTTATAANVIAGNGGAFCFRFVNPNVGIIYSNNNTSSGKFLGAGYTDAAIVGVAVDFTHSTIWFRLAPSGNWNGDAAANPATNTGGVSWSTFTGSAMTPVVSFGGTGNSNTENFTANFGASAFSGAVPSGFTSGWPL